MYTGSLGTLSNREDYDQDFQAFDDTDTALDLTGATIVFEFRDKQTKASALEASTANGKITIVTTTFTVALSPTDTRTLCAKDYDLGCTLLLNGVTTQLFAGTISVIDGIVT